MAQEQVMYQAEQENKRLVQDIETVRRLLTKHKAEDLIPILIPDGLEATSPVKDLPSSINWQTDIERLDLDYENNILQSSSGGRPLR